MNYSDVRKYAGTDEHCEPGQNPQSIAGMLPFWRLIYQTMGVLGLTGWQARLMCNWVPVYEERRFTEQKCLAASRRPKTGGWRSPLPT